MDNAIEKNINDLIVTNIWKKKQSFLNILSEEEWNDLYKEVCFQSLSCLLYRSVSDNSSIPKSILGAWKNSALFGQISSCRMLKELNELFDCFEEKNINAVVIKGYSIARLYQNYYERPSGDIDILVNETDFVYMSDILSDKGYTFVKGNHYHDEYIREGICVEIHKDLPNMPTGKRGIYLRNIMNKGIEESEKVSLGNYQFRMLPSLQNGLVLLRHILQHMANGLGLKQIIDWMIYAERELNDDQWDEVKLIYTKCGLKDAAVIVTRMCQIYLGLDENRITWCKDAPVSLCHDLYEYLYEKGNFGLKEKLNVDKKGIVVLTRDQGFFSKLMRFQNHGLKNWEACKRYPILRGFAWLHTLIRYIDYVCKRDNAIHEFADELRIGNKRKQLFKKMRCSDDSIIAKERLV